MRRAWPVHTMPHRSLNLFKQLVVSVDPRIIDAKLDDGVNFLPPASAQYGCVHRVNFLLFSDVGDGEHRTNAPVS